MKNGFLEIFDKQSLSIGLWIAKHGLSANMITSVGLVFAALGLNFVSVGKFNLALLFFFLNRFADILDGTLARAKGIKPFGIFLDAFADLLSYGFFLWGFVVYNPLQNGGAISFLLVSFYVFSGALLIYAFLLKANFFHFNRSDAKAAIISVLNNTDIFLCVLLLLVFPSYVIWIAGLFGILFSVKSLLVLSKAYYNLEILKKGKI